jgi:hypothetical protein
MMRAILTDGRGRPIERPESPAPGATLEDCLAYIRAVHAYNDQVADLANGAFDVAFRRSMKKSEKSG